MKKPTVYTVATAHLDTSWLWPLEKSVTEYLPDTLKKNFSLLEKFPHYKFNFEGSYRYELIKEYYPAQYEKLKKYIAEGRWHPAGACYENGDVNIPSPEALLRNILYGNSFFEKEFGIRSNDIFLPDCFGFGRALPSVAAHAGLTGFSTCKLVWGCAVDAPFELGRWHGIDGNGVWASLRPYSYTSVLKDLRKDKRYIEKLEADRKKNGLNCTFVYHGIGDRGGSPHISSVKMAEKAVCENKNHEMQVLSATTKEFFDDLENLPAEVKNNVPVFNGEFLLTAHGAGSYTSRTVTKRWNKRCELLADTAERFASAAFVNGFADYPQATLDAAWKRVIAHHFHDDITGTSFEECYRRNHNDYVLAMHTFSEEFTAACKALVRHMDTSFVQGTAVVVANPVQTADKRCEAVRVKLQSDADSFCVFDADGTEVPAQTSAIGEHEREVVFLASLGSCALAVFDVREGKSNTVFNTGLCVSANEIENKNLLVKLDEHGDICSVFDKKMNRELLKKPVRTTILNDVHSFKWPAWEIAYEDIKSEPYMYADHPVVTVLSKGEALCELKIERTAGNSRFVQILSLDAESEFVSVYNETDWREEASLLKTEFSLASENDFADYDIGLGSTRRATNTERCYEVPAQKWAGITDEKTGFGVGIFSDSRTGWDKPDRSTLRLTAVHTPMANYRWECSQHLMDIGINRYSYAIAGSENGTKKMTVLADCFAQPMHTFVSDRHTGTLGTGYEFVTVNDDAVRITALKKEQDGNRVIIRFAETQGEDHACVTAEFAKPVLSAFAVRGDEKEIAPAQIVDGKLQFAIGHNGLATFAIEFDDPQSVKNTQKVLSMPFNAVGFTAQNKWHTSTLPGGVSVPMELVPENLLTGGVHYAFEKENKNALVCDGGALRIVPETRCVHLLLTSLNGDKTVCFGVGDKKVPVTVQDCFENVGNWDLASLGETGFIKPYSAAYTFSHTHTADGDAPAKQFYLFHAAIPTDGNTRIILPDNKDIVIFAATAEESDLAFTKGDAHFDSLAKRDFDYRFSKYARKHARPNRLERFLNLFIDSTRIARVKFDGFYNKYAINEIYFILRHACDSLTYKKKAAALAAKRKSSEILK
ncbi:MAG: hypothetical protein IKB13_07415 [Clostridia bacterium]|nr:hypothetical protein [Clostridia bacterium]